MPVKNSVHLERFIKGVANHWRIDILRLVSANPHLNLEQIVEKADGNHKTLAVHVSKMVQAGLLEKKYKGREVIHTVTPLGKRMYDFLRTF